MAKSVCVAASSMQDDECMCVLRALRVDDERGRIWLHCLFTLISSWFVLAIVAGEMI